VYFAFAKAFVHPDWIPGSSTLKDEPGSRILFDSVVGRLLGFASFEQVALAGRAMCALLLAWPLARLFRQQQLGVLPALLLTQLVCAVDHQSFFGKEWMIGAFESKVVAYAFVFQSLYWLLERRALASVVWAALAVWCHVLVGGWYGIALFAHLLLTREPPLRLLRLAATYAALTAPLALYLWAHYVADNPRVIDGIVVSQIYVFFRNPQHLDMLSQLRYAGSAAQVGLVLSLLCVALCWRLVSRSEDRHLRQLSLLSLILFAFQFTGLAIALFDHQGAFLKYYPYRTSSLSFLLALVILARLWAQPQLRRPLPALLRGAAARPAARALHTAAWMVACLGLALALRLGPHLVESAHALRPPPPQAARLAMLDWIRDHTPRDAVFLDLGRHESIDFMRRTARESFAVFKFVPTTNRLIHDWYVRVQERKRAAADPRHVLTLAQTRRIDYVLTQAPVDENGFRLVRREPGWYLYALQRPGIEPAAH